MTTFMKAPVVFDYLDLGLYLKDYYQYRKHLDKGFSYEAWAAELDFRSRSFLRMMIVGKKKLTPTVTESIQRKHFLSKEEQNYFFYLVKFSQATGVKEKQLYSQKMMQILRSLNNSQLIADSDDFISDPLLPRLLSLFSYDDVENSAPSFAKVLDVSQKRIEDALTILNKLGLIEQTATPQIWTSKVTTFKVPDSKGSLNLRKFHEKSLQEALHAFDLPNEVRSYKSLLLPMSPEDFSLFLQALDEFSGEQIIRHNVKDYVGKRLFQVNFNAYPVSEALEAAHTPQSKT
ncbi:MAG: TIGR02147 family protein [Bdellovibrio sp.]|nr:TIGR02147 family protein [Bdellovibrio sp.]